MLKSRTVKTWTFFIASMVIGSVALTLMETPPIEVSRSLLMGTSAMGQGPDRTIIGTYVPVKTGKWHNIVVLDSRRSKADTIGKTCHFVIDVSAPNGQRVKATDLWKRQDEGYHTVSPTHDWHSDSIGVCFVGKLSKIRPQSEQMMDLSNVVRALQQHFGIGPERVYLHSDIDTRSLAPSDAFQAAFNASLLKL